MKLLLERGRREAQANEQERAEVRAALRLALARHAPGCAVWLYGSVAAPGAFDCYSDVDVAFETLPTGCSLFLLQSLLSNACGRPVDVCLVDETRLKDKILREGERWTG